MKRDYKTYSQATQSYMKAVEKFLKEKYSGVNDEWQQPLKMLADNIEVFNKCASEISVQGLMLQAKNGAYCKNPLIKVQNDAQVQIVKLLGEFGLTPKGSAKLNLQSDDEDDLKDLLGGD